MTKPQFPADLVTFTKEIFNGKLHFFCSDTLIAGIAKFKIGLFILVKHLKSFGFWRFQDAKNENTDQECRNDTKEESY